MPLDAVETLCELIGRPSVNPMGREVDGEPYYEHRVTDYLQQFFERLGLEWIHRLCQEPMRLARRYLIQGIPFALKLLWRSWRNRV